MQRQQAKQFFDLVEEEERDKIENALETIQEQLEELIILLYGATEHGRSDRKNPHKL